MSSFARLKPTELLRETEKAIGGGELLKLHEDLIASKIQLNEDTQVGLVTMYLYPQAAHCSRILCLSSEADSD